MCETCRRDETPTKIAPRGTLAASDRLPLGLGLIFDTTDFSPRWQCGHWSSFHGWVHIVSDAMIFGAYAAIPLALAFFIRKRGDLPFPRIFWLFCIFIFACGTGHLVESTLFWWPWYRLSAILKALTAIVSWLTVLSLLPILPKALALPGLQKINDELRREVSVRRTAEERARAKAEELARFNRATIGREMRVVELKREVNQLAEKLGMAPRYAVVEGIDPGGDHNSLT